MTNQPKVASRGENDLKKSRQNYHQNMNNISSIMPDQSNNSPVSGSGKNKRGNDSQNNTSQNQGNVSNENGKHNNQGQNYLRNANSISFNFHFEGVKPELGGGLALHTEKVDKKLPYQVFREKLTKYVMTKLDGGKDIQIELFHIKDLFEQ